MAGERVLIVDDSLINLRLLSEILQRHGYAVDTAMNGYAALEMARADPPDLILLDVMMPRMDGYEVCRRLKEGEHTRDVPIIFISALGEVESKVRAFTVGGVDYITKPFRVPEVVARVETHLALRRTQQRLKAEIEARDRLIEELDAYAHTVAHGLKGPLGLLKGYAELLASDYTTMSPQEIRQSVEGIARGADKMTEIINALLLLASTHRDVEMTSLDMGEIVHEALQRLTGEVDRSEAEIVLPEHWPSVLGFAPWVEEVWTNYISNAVKYGGNPPRVELGYDDEPPSYVRFWVQDNGPGLTPEEQQRLFTPFERLHHVGVAGHGLGLSIVKRIVERLQGEVGVESALGAGSRFFFTLRRPEHPPA